MQILSTLIPADCGEIRVADHDLATHPDAVRTAIGVTGQFGSGFVPTTSMPAGLRWFARYQPFTPVIETLRGLLLGARIGNNAALALAWSVAITVLSYVWARRLFDKRPAR